jgi:hypothetical protein
MTLDYGTDLSITDDIAPDFHTSSGRRLLCEAIVRRLITRKGSLRRHPQYGYDVRDELNDDLGPGDLARISSGVIEQCMRDTRVIQATSGSLALAGQLCCSAAAVRRRAKRGSTTLVQTRARRNHRSV